MREFLESISAARPWLERAGFRDHAAAHRNLVAIAEGGVPLDLYRNLIDQLGRYLPVCADPDMALNNFERLLKAARSPLSMATFLVRKPHSLVGLVQMFAASQFFSDVVISNPELFDFLWEQGHATFDVRTLSDLIQAEVAASAGQDDLALRVLRRHRQRELLRIGYRDIVLGHPLEQITESIADLADCLLDASVAIAYRWQTAKFGQPRTSDGQVAQLVILGMGKLGGRELNYSSDIDLIVIFDHSGSTDGPRQKSNLEFFEQIVRDVVRLLSANTPWGQCYRVDLRLRPHGGQSSLCQSLDSTLDYYDKHGRTWERQALVKARPVAGSHKLGQTFLSAIEPFIYRRYLTYGEINEIKSIKRKIEKKTSAAGGATTDLKTGNGGIRDIEFVTQFLQLLNGGAMPAVRERNTLRALRKLASAGCITHDEHNALETAYRFLRKAEHRLQFMFDLQTHRIPDDPDELDKLARRLGCPATEEQKPRDWFFDELIRVTDRNREMLRRLMLDLFVDEAPSSSQAGAPETDLVLDPIPDEQTIEQTLKRYGFTEPQAAYRNLMALAEEEVAFLSSVRCRHFLANLAPALLATVAEAPDSDMALLNLAKVTSSLGAKGILWETCSSNRPLLRLYVQICSWSQFLSEILINHPGMIDELLETLGASQPVTIEGLGEELDALLRGATQIEPILHAFQNTWLLNIGVHDILAKKDLRRSGRELSDLAEVIIRAIARQHYEELVAQFGVPRDSVDGPSPYSLIGVGKFGGRELSYHSDLDLVLVYESDGKTVPCNGQDPSAATMNHHFYTELAQRIVRTAAQLGPLGRLYEVDFRLRPTGRSGALVIPLDKFAAYYHEGGAALWERMALTRARVVAGSPLFGRRVMDTIRAAIGASPWNLSMAKEADEMRKKLEASRPASDLKRGPGGIVDIEFVVQLMQLRHGIARPDLLEANIWDALDRLEAANLLSKEVIGDLRSGYTFLRQVQNRIRIVYNAGRDEFPEPGKDLTRLAHRLGYDGVDAGNRFLADLNKTRQTIRQRYDECIAAFGDNVD